MRNVGSHSGCQNDGRACASNSSGVYHCGITSYPENKADEACEYSGTQNHTFTYDEPIKVESVTEAVGDLAMRFGESTADEDALMVSCGSMQSCNITADPGRIPHSHGPLV